MRRLTRPFSASIRPPELGAMKISLMFRKRSRRAVIGTGAGRCRAVLIEFYRAVCIEYHSVIEPRPDENAHIQRVVTGLTWLISDEHVTRNTALERFHANLVNRCEYKKNRFNKAWLSFKVRNRV